MRTAFSIQAYITHNATQRLSDIILDAASSGATNFTLLFIYEVVLQAVKCNQRYDGFKCEFIIQGSFIAILSYISSDIT